MSNELTKQLHANSIHLQQKLPKRLFHKKKKKNQNQCLVVYIV